MHALVVSTIAVTVGRSSGGLRVHSPPARQPDRLACLLSDHFSLDRTLATISHRATTCVRAFATATAPTGKFKCRRLQSRAKIRSRGDCCSRETPAAAGSMGTGTRPCAHACASTCAFVAAPLLARGGSSGDGQRRDVRRHLLGKVVAVLDALAQGDAWCGMNGVEREWATSHQPTARVTRHMTH